MMQVDLWVPGIRDRVGGIQTFSAFLRRALEESATVRVYSKHDQPGGQNETAAGDVPLLIRTCVFIVRVAIGTAAAPPNLIVVTHLHFAPLALVLARILGIPFWVVAHGVEAWRIRGVLTRFAVRRSDRVLAVSRSTREIMIQRRYVSSDQIDLLPNTADASIFTIGPRDDDLRRRLAIPLDAKVLLTVARLDPTEQYKGYDKIIALLNAPELRSVHYVIVGDGADRSRAEDLVQRGGLADRVHFVGRVPDAVLPDYYRLCDLFVMPSSGEGFGIVFLEAMFSGRPCLGGSRDGSRDALLDGTLGILADPDNPEELLAAVCNGLSQSRRPEEIRQAAIAAFGCDVFLSKVQKFLKRLA